MNGWFDDFEVGARFPTRTRTITDADHEAFCRLVGYEVPLFHNTEPAFRVFFVRVS